jgi:CRISPR-associated protein Csx17
MQEPEQDIDWSKTTFEGVRREQLRRWSALTVRQRLEALDQMTDLAELVQAQRLSRRVIPASDKPRQPI